MHVWKQLCICLSFPLSSCRLHEFDEQVSAVREGMARVVPVPLLSLFTGYELETMVRESSSRLWSHICPQVVCRFYSVCLFLCRCAEARTSRCTCWSQWPLIKGWSRQHLSFSGSGTWWSPSQTQRGLYSWGSSGAAHVCRAPSLISEEETLWSRWETQKLSPDSFSRFSWVKGLTLRHQLPAQMSYCILS